MPHFVIQGPSQTMKLKKPDYLLLSITAILMFFGLVMINSSGIVFSLERFGEPYFFLRRQFISLCVGLTLAYIAYKLDYKIWKKLAPWLILTNLILLALVFVPPLGYGPGDTKRWLNLGFASIQPSEFLKLSVIIYLSALWGKESTKKEETQESLNKFTTLISLLAIIGLFLIKQPDMGTFGIIVLMGISIFFLSGAKIQYIVLLGAGGIISFFLLLKTASYRVNRWITFLHPEIDPQGIGYQINQALLALGSGGLFGLGLSQSRQKYNFLPEPITDSITAIIGEELGYIGLLFLIFLFVALIMRALKISKNAPDNFAQILAGGIIIMISVQTFIHLGAVSGMLPMTGVPLPFISYGGSALIVNLIGIGLLLNISKYT